MGRRSGRIGGNENPIQNGNAIRGDSFCGNMVQRACRMENDPCQSREIGMGLCRPKHSHLRSSMAPLCLYRICNWPKSLSSPAGTHLHCAGGRRLSPDIFYEDNLVPLIFGQLVDYPDNSELIGKAVQSQPESTDVLPRGRARDCTVFGNLDVVMCGVSACQAPRSCPIPS